ncbi:MAG TPA: adenosylcobinamide-phosphate synthase CbiB, partial [Bryobacteraceae bacterium]|nr:adenosylcobinamide-phosphate synthase CbiB [Bryobacteraceae bacterium]
LGDPEWLPHPVRWFGALTSQGERVARRWCCSPVSELIAGAAVTAAIVCSGAVIGSPKDELWQALLGWSALATRSLLNEARAVVRAIEAGDIGLARQRLARIVGRDTELLDEPEIARATIETLAESACDGIVAPLFWLALGGARAGLAYKAINTLDSMIGHPEPPYRYFGLAAARLDDAASFIPARLTALAIAAAALVTRRNARDALLVWHRDGGRHASPNAGQSESAMAGTLGVRLGGINTYGGQMHASPLLNAEARLPNVADIQRAISHVAVVSALAFGAALLFTAVRGRR